MKITCFFTIFYVKINFGLYIKHKMAISQFSWARSHYDVIVIDWLVLILVSMERGYPYLYTGSKFRVIWPSVLIIQRGVQQPPLGKYVGKNPQENKG